MDGQHPTVLLMQGLYGLKVRVDPLSQRAGDATATGASPGTDRISMFIRHCVLPSTGAHDRALLCTRLAAPYYRR